MALAKVCIKIIVCICCATFGFARAADYPTRPIRLITPASPGGTTDILARLLGARLTEVYRQQVVVDNRASSSGVIAAEMTAVAPPDGYTLLLPYHQHTVNAALNSRLPYHPVNSFTPITQLTAAGLLLVVHPAAPVKSLKEFVDWTRTFKGALNYGSGGIGTGGHLVGELYKHLAGVKAEHIPYKGGAAVLLAGVAGEYHYIFAGMQSAQPLVRSGKLRAIAVSTPQRLRAMPELPAVAETVPGFEFVGWYGLLAPAALPRVILARLHQDVIKILAQPDVRERISLDGSEAVGNSPDSFRMFLLADMEKWAKLAKESGAKLD